MEYPKWEKGRKKYEVCLTVHHFYEIMGGQLDATIVIY
jgi:hypothetical protein